MKPAALLTAAICLAAANASALAAEHACAAHARERADALLRFHSDNDDRVEIDREVKQIPGIRNPANQRQRFDVLEIWGYIYKGQYRMRFVYAQLEGCTLMGEEVLQYARL